MNMNDIFQATNNNYSDTVTTKVMKCAINNAIYQLSFVVCKSYLQLYKSRWSIYEKVGGIYNLNEVYIFYTSHFKAINFIHTNDQIQPTNLFHCIFKRFYNLILIANLSDNLHGYHMLIQCYITTIDISSMWQEGKFISCWHFRTYSQASKIQTSRTSNPNKQINNCG